MNMTDVIKRVKRRLGLAVIATPYKDIDDEIVDIVLEDTLPTFSLYQPRKTKKRINLKNLKKIKDDSQLGANASHATYLLPDEMVQDLLYIFDLNYADNSIVTTNYYGLPMGYLGGASAQNLMLGNASSKLGQMMIPKPTYHWEEPKLFTIYGQYITSDFILDLGYKHNKSLNTIEETARESFLNLAVIDVQVGLYPTMKQYTEINSPIGNINLKIDDWADALSKRTELLEEWNNSYIYDMFSTPIYC